MWKTLAFVAALLAGWIALAGPALAGSAALVPTNEWRVYKPNLGFRDLPAFRPKERGEVPDFGLLTFVCQKSEVFILFVQPSLAMSATTPARISAGDLAPIELSIRNLYASRAPLSKLINWDADIFFSEAPRELVSALVKARQIRLEIGDRNYLIDLDDFAARWPSFEAYCLTGAVRDPRAFGVR